MSKQAKFAYDVFVAYSEADEGWVRGQLLPTLKAAALNVTCF